MQVTRRTPVLIVNVPAHDDAQTLNIEESVLCFERIKGLLDQINARGQRMFTLSPLQTPPQSAIPVFRQNARHVAVQIRSSARFQARNAKAESDHF